VAQSHITITVTRERTIHLVADTIRFRKISADSIPIRFAYLIAYFVRSNDDDGGHRWREYWRRDTAVTGAARERRESAQKGGSRGGTEKDAAGTRDSVDRLRPPLDTRPLCVRRCVHVIGQSHNRRGADCRLR